MNTKEIAVKVRELKELHLMEEELPERRSIIRNRVFWYKVQIPKVNNNHKYLLLSILVLYLTW